MQEPVRGGEEEVFVAASCMQACNLCRSKEQSQSFSGDKHAFLITASTSVCVSV